MRCAVRRLEQQDRIVRILLIHQLCKRLAKGIDSSPGSVRIREMESRSRSNPFEIVAAAASCLFKYRIDFVTKGDLLSMDTQCVGREEYCDEKPSVHNSPRLLV